MTARDVIAGEISEADLLGAITVLARRCGWLVYHTHDSRRSEAGFPDLVLTRDGELLFWELKTERGKVTETQQRWLDALTRTGREARVVRPRDLDDVIEQLKLGKAPTQ